ncbi:unnamed protein product [Arabidopsis thaliana]|uniref:Uncharacterized protein n=3 Tax=Arabidopsis TaxID=3701 RepID=A0A654FAP5_ARATH|nr:uncharacterized protein AT3G25200 [Arabidopsis thaliana]AEE76992.1 hypothetical protein AT3G25200 [Arabidopsis thaliana]KAG7626517.1 hypothetical protein ISN45_At03g026630 [Arabidopsis thaliana x Arabidopsis arenosa]VYS58544.1 unnamed protein product [Arabidopsis thaliana]|eukprot:NP_189157.1 hypothetical protein AT3G25200 [Arabidopsis thaliana]
MATLGTSGVSHPPDEAKVTEDKCEIMWSAYPCVAASFIHDGMLSFFDDTCTWETRTVLWLSSFWDLNSAFSDLLKATLRGGPTPHHRILGSPQTQAKESEVAAPKPTKTQRELLESCLTSVFLLESQPTNETFLVKWYKKTSRKIMKTKGVMVFKLDHKGNAIYTQDI